MPSGQPEYITGGRPRGKGEVNEGTLKGDQYDRKDFYIRSVDHHHNRDSIRTEFIKAPPYLNALVQKWVNDPRTPYTSAADLLRDAAHHRIHDLEELAEDETFDWGFLGLAEKRDQLAREARDMNAQAEAFQADITLALQHGDYVWLEQLIDIAKDAIGQFREPYRTRIQNIVQPYLDGTVTLAQNDRRTS